MAPYGPEGHYASLQMPAVLVGVSRADQAEARPAGLQAYLVHGRDVLAGGFLKTAVPDLPEAETLVSSFT